MPRKRTQTRPLAALLLALTLALSTIGALHVAAHAVEGDGAGHCDACRVVKAAPLALGANSDFAEPLPVCGAVGLARRVAVIQCCPSMPEADHTEATEATEGKENTEIFSLPTPALEPSR
jgi:hypothetical protein